MAEYHTIRDIQDALDTALNKRRAMIEGAMAEDRSMTDDETDVLNRLQNEVDKLSRMKTALEQQHELESNVAESRQRARLQRQAQKLTETPAEEEKALEATYDKYLRDGLGALNTEQRGRMAKLSTRGTSAQAVGTDSLGGYLVPPGFQREIEKAMLAFGGVMSVARILRTSTGNDLEWPTVDDTATTGSLLAENTAATVSDVTFGSITFNAYKYTSGIVKVSNELLQDSAFDLNEFLRDVMAERIARALNAAFTTGDGSSKPKGVVTAATDSTLDSTANLPTYDELLAFFHSVDPSYRANGTFMMADDSLMAIRKVRTYDGTIATPEFAFQNGLAPGAPGTIFGRPYVINQQMANDTTAGNEWLLFGDFSKYIVRQAMGIEIVRLVERYMDAYQTGFIAFARYDGDLIDAGTNPIKYLEVSA